MPLTKEELLIPRCKVIGKIPFLRKEDAELYQIDYIITDDGIRPATNSNGDPVFITEWEEYPHIFQPLPWWSDRKLFELPEYVVCIKTPDQKIMPGMVLKVAWCAANWGTDYVHTVILDTNCYEPATEEEYTAYINQKQQ